MLLAAAGCSQPNEPEPAFIFLITLDTTRADAVAAFAHLGLDGWLDRLPEGIVESVWSSADALKLPTVPDSLLLEVFTNEGTGTLVVNDIAALTPAEQGGESS